MGRDISIVAKHEKSEKEFIRAIVDSDNIKNLSGDKVRFNLKANKVFVFDKESGERI